MDTLELEKVLDKGEAPPSYGVLSKSWLRRALAAAGLWLDERTGWVSAVRSLLDWPVPTYAARNILYSLGGLTFLSLLLQFSTGILMAFHYDPSIADAYNSVDYITYYAPLGWLVRSLHYYNASAIVVLAVLHLLRTFAFGAYQRPREITWLSGVLLLLVVMAFAFTGYLLPWDQQSYWSTKVSLGIAGTMPAIGELLTRILAGGPSMGQLTLLRFYIIHTMLLPLTLLLMLALHLFQLRRHGFAPLPRRDRQTDNKFVPLYPNWVARDVVLGLGLLCVLFVFSWTQRAPLEFPADPTSVEYEPRPEWYFLFLYKILSYTPGFLEPLVIVLLPAVIIGSMVLLPFVDRNEGQPLWRKPALMATALFYIGIILLFTGLAL
jgi:ubiquinol-cytochrome c reductase cytochrome b subunit